MAVGGIYEVTSAFDWAGVSYRVGQLVNGDAEVVSKFGSKFTITTLQLGNSATGTSVGNCVKKIEVFNAAGTSLGFIPVYDAIT